MRHTNRSAVTVAFSVFLTVCLLQCRALAWEITKPLAEGVSFTQIVTEAPAKVINIVTVDPKFPGAIIKATSAGETMHSASAFRGKATVSTAARRLGAVAAVNADFFIWQSGYPLGLLVSDGELKCEPYARRTAFAISKNGEYLFGRPYLEASVTAEGGASRPLGGVNRLRGKNKIVAYTRAFAVSTHTNAEGTEVVVCTSHPPRPGEPISGTVKEVRASKGNTPLGEDTLVLSSAGAGAKWLEENLKPGTNLTILFNLKSDDGKDWNSIVEAVGGGPRLIKDGTIVNSAKEEGFGTSIYTAAHPRTAIGTTSDGKVLMVTVDGRQPQSRGMTLQELAKLMLGKGCVQAINLDGGGSTTLATAYGVLNSPSDGRERPVANAVAVLGTPLKGDAGTEIKIDVPTHPVEAGSICRLLLVDPATGQPVSESCAKDTIWSVEGGGIFVDQSGSFTARTARAYTITARYKDRITTRQIEVAAGPPANMTPLLEEVSGEEPCASQVTVTVWDAFKNPVKDAKVFIKVSGGTPEKGEAITGSNGRADAAITWDSEFIGVFEVEVSCGNLKKTLVRPAKKSAGTEQNPL
jgi:exopolysaccharide biosynthesis protein